MNRPYILCNMLTALDGKITGPYMFDEYARKTMDAYDRIHESFGAKAWMCGRKTMEENFTLGQKPDLQKVDEKIPRKDFIAKKDAPVYCLSVDTKGKLGWPANTIAPYNGRAEAHVVEILTEQVSDEFLAFLQRMEISYLFAGKEELDIELLLEKVKNVLGADLLLLEGGGSLNGSFLEKGLIDELSLVLTPIADGAVHTPTLFEAKADPIEYPAMKFELKSVEKLDGDGLWIRYKTML